MIKYLITLGLVYVVYRWVINPPKSRQIHGREDEVREIEYTDYEEIDD